MANNSKNGFGSRFSALDQHPSYKWFVLANVMIGTFMAVLDSTIVNVEFDVIERNEIADAPCAKFPPADHSLVIAPPPLPGRVCAIASIVVPPRFSICTALIYVIGAFAFRFLLRIIEPVTITTFSSLFTAVFSCAIAGDINIIPEIMVPASKAPRSVFCLFCLSNVGFS